MSTSAGRRSVRAHSEAAASRAAMVVRSSKLSQDARRDRAAIDAVFTVFPKLLDRQNQLAGRLSGGEQQMLAIGPALVAAPRLAR